MIDHDEIMKHAYRNEHAGVRALTRELTRFDQRLGDVMVPVLQQLARIKTLDDSLVARRAEGDAAFSRATARIAERAEVTDSDLADLERFATTATHAPSPVSRAVEQARAVLGRETYAAAQTVAPLVFVELQRIAAEAVQVAEKVKVPETIIDERSFLAADLDVRIWTRLSSAASKFFDAHKLYIAMRKARWLPLCSEGAGNWTMWTAPHKRVVRFGRDDANSNVWRLLLGEDVEGSVSFGRGSESLPAPLRLAHSIAKGAGPRMVDVEQAARDNKAWLLARQREAKRGSGLFSGRKS